VINGIIKANLRPANAGKAGFPIPSPDGTVPYGAYQTGTDGWGYGETWFPHTPA